MEGRQQAPQPQPPDVVAFEARSDIDRVTADVAALAATPRGSTHHPAEMARAQDYVTERLEAVGWRVTRAPFRRRWTVGVTDAGGRQVFPWRLYRTAPGTNLLADLPDAPTRPRVLLVAHLDSVACSVGADDNASGVAALLECARLLAGLPHPPPVRLAIVDLEERACQGSRALARQRDIIEGLELVVALEAVGTFLDDPGSQRLGGLALAFPSLARQVRARESRGDFLLAVHRRTSASAAGALASAAAGLSTPLPVLAMRDPRPDGRMGRVATIVRPWLIDLDRSDHAPFWRRGVPAMMLTTTAPFRNRHYHREGDRPENLDYPRLTAVATAVAATAVTWCASAAE